ncbi:DUF3727 domain-containing protein [Anabaena cylindrica FACHB-243]|uniref:DUF3727 domain-containing protein n=1 Tax=Anabaena cylindrica (strain ATCC 27899 / PCC 7122) TaxID=272123 RepID=K9ZL78_ANACC|nr:MULTISPECIES: DUF3727 domain-containing protein [Anabaena]AFZ59085.1 protein of unknown function DUF1292 [Anabaena cylindrica PCC 7122]MBD2420576.1 DUF3727 domain-containing protein [Anabaena cylindrica FACHB-243]MBY5284441.1 DUF3727 domain-containing protein [Anabaena sp. CCAP 1446/1C]MBY5308994.1 DUF3727 domain-containing protein [Anabaena sp. CCAP 1446/1C]MCM2408534.1 DUF3727 domain-containing protein [Anabaena sp. CCAP 1446/1C]
MYSSEFSEENDHANSGSITLTDDKERSLECYIEHSLSVDEQEYVLLLPVDSPIEIFAWQDEGEEEEAVLVEDDATIDKIFSTAQAVLSEQNLIIKNTAYALTVAGELPPVEESELFTLEIEDDEADLEPEQLQLLASFYHENQEYAIYTPLDPLLFFARITNTGKPELLSPEEFRKVQPLLEEHLFNEVE